MISNPVGDTSQYPRERPYDNIDYLPHEEVAIEPESKVCPYCGDALHVIGEGVSKRLNRAPAKLRVVVTRTCDKNGETTSPG
jgi:transposase